MKKWIAIFFFLYSPELFAQKGNELLVYAVKGDVTAIFNNEESAVKIGKVLKPGTLIRTRKDASLTMLCKKGKPLVHAREGEFPVSLWKDSCKYNSNSITANYFSFIWSEFYTYSAEYKEELRKRNELAVSRGDGPSQKKKNKSSRLQVKFSPGMDTLNYGTKDFLLSWTCFEYGGRYIFKLYDVKGTLIHADSVIDNFIPVSSLVNKMEPGKSYKWTIVVPGAGFIRKRTLNYISQEKIDVYSDSLQQIYYPNEDSASRYFRIAYLLEKKHYLGDVFEWYRKATYADPSIEAYRDKFIRFRNEFWIR